MSDASACVWPERLPGSANRKIIKTELKTVFAAKTKSQ